MVEYDDFMVSKPPLVKKRIKDFISIKERIEIWSDLGIWQIENKEFYSDWFHQEIKRLKPIIIEFVNDGYSHAVCEKYKLKYKFLRRFVYWFTKKENLILALLKANGWKRRLGLEIAKGQFRLFKSRNHRLPTGNDKGMNSILYACSQGYWKEYGIETWNDLLKSTFGEINFEYKKYTGYEGLKQAEKELLEYYEKNSKKPTSKYFAGICNAINRGEWIEFGIKTWNDLLKSIFGEVNYGSSKYKGKRGLERAVQELKEFYQKDGKKPTLIEIAMSGIYNAIQKGEWIDFGIKTWNDLLKFVFGEVNYVRNKYKGKKGLDRATQEIKDFYQKNGKKPRVKDRGMAGIYDAIQRREWIDFGIKTWNDLLKSIFGEINLASKKYIGLEGFNRAIQEIKEFFKKNKRIPDSNQKKMKGIISAIYRGEFERFGIKTWNDLLKIALGKINLEQNKYKGKNGLERAIQEIKEFYQKYGKKPTTKDLGSISNAVYNGRWAVYGVIYWDDMLNLALNKKKI